MAKRDDEKYYLDLERHMPHPAKNVGVSEPGGDKSETPTKDLPSVEGNQRRERVMIGAPLIEEDDE